ncbi:sporulation integral membrane protein YtvI [Bacillus sp. FJAT-27225]|uniref:sporulation integral membrane protein YtvI n=1 Tax=Bacillus sp. FJAT-27225 TaxID=1743144 RepID=UPI00080C27E9|nr:sporulation integral membrane protein YtvI [Bacillus sp. FJAT-27225]OCA85571.1 sporulation integral membrane protein YtvI [Bacillus sp. FJAT-27225]
MAGFFSKKRVIWIIGVLLTAVAAYFLVPAGAPIILALLTALLLEPAVRFTGSRLKLNRQLSVLLVFLLFLSLTALGGYFITTKLAAQVISMANEVPGYVNKISRLWVETKWNLVRAMQDLPEQLVQQIIQRIENSLYAVINVLLEYMNIEKVRALVTQIPKFFIGFLVYLIALFLFMLEIPALKKAAYAHLTAKTAEKANVMSARLFYVITGFLKGQILVSVIIFAVSLLYLYLYYPEAALIGAFLIWAFDFIPVVGSMLLLVPWLLFYALAGNMEISFKLAFLTVILLAIRYYLEPRMLGSYLKLSPLATLASMYIGFKLVGLIGIIFGPILVICISAAREAGIFKFNFKL